MTGRPHEWRANIAGREAPGYTCRVCGAAYVDLQDECPGSDARLEVDLRERLYAVSQAVARLSLDIRTRRGEQVGVKKTTLRAVGSIVENAAQELARAVERSER